MKKQPKKIETPKVAPKKVAKVTTKKTIISKGNKTNPEVNDPSFRDLPYMD